VATGHYARVEQGADGRWLLRRGVDPDKDQAYFLFSLTQSSSHGRLPVGALTKTDVRAQARALGLRVAEKPDSQEICFVPGRRLRELRRAPGAGGSEGRRDCRRERPHARHARRRPPLHHRTAEGLGVSSPAPLYVLRIDADSGQVTVGPRDALERRSLTASQVNWTCGDSPERVARRDRADPPSPSPAGGRVRALLDGRAAFECDEPLSAVTPGQAAVFYDGDVVVGGGWID
jgi:tRNA-specific 2-thiouridylase